MKNAVSEDGKHWRNVGDSLLPSKDGIHFEPCCEFPNRAAGIYVLADIEEQKEISNYWGIGVKTHDTHKKDIYIGLDLVMFWGGSER